MPSFEKLRSHSRFLPERRAYDVGRIVGAQEWDVADGWDEVNISDDTLDHLCVHWNGRSAARGRRTRADRGLARRIGACRRAEDNQGIEHVKDELLAD